MDDTQQPCMFESFRVWWAKGVHGWGTHEYGAEHTLARDAWCAAWAAKDDEIELRTERKNGGEAES